MAETIFLQIFNLDSKNGLFQFWSYFAIFSVIAYSFVARNVSNDREFFCLPDGLFLIFFESRFLKESN